MIRALIVIITFIIASIISFFLGEKVINKVYEQIKRIWTIFCFNALFWFAIYVVPLFSLSIPDKDTISVASIILTIASIILPFLTIFVGNKLITYNKEIIDVKYKNIIYLISVIVGFGALLKFAWANRNIKDSNANDILQYLVAPMGLLLGELLPISCLYSNKGFITAFTDNVEENYSLKGRGAFGCFVVVFSIILNLIIFLIFNCESAMRFIDTTSNILFILGIGGALALSPVPYILIDKKHQVKKQ